MREVKERALTLCLGPAICKEATLGLVKESGVLARLVLE